MTQKSNKNKSIAMFTIYTKDSLGELIIDNKNDKIYEFKTFSLTPFDKLNTICRSDKQRKE